VPGSSSFSTSAREQAHGILAHPPYRTTPSHAPRPLAGVFHAIGRGLNAALGRPASWLYHHLLVHIGHGLQSTFGGWWVIVVGVMATVLGAAMAVMIVKRRARISTRDVASVGTGAGTEDPDDIDHRALAAESTGDHETAVRLFFRAGLLRLQMKGLLSNQNAQTTRQLTEHLHSPTFNALAERHEVIVYARQPATAVDVDTARRDWPRVLAESQSGSGQSP
jgi:hypothetical protein